MADTDIAEAPEATHAEAPEATHAEAPAHHLGISDRAAERLARLTEQEGDPDLMLRVGVDGGGCSGFRYSFDFDKQVNADDRVFRHGSVAVVVDEISLELLDGSQVDFVEEMIGAYFQVNNPNAKSSCGCGSSFAI